MFQEKVIPEEDEEDSSLSEAREPPVSSSPYDSAIEGYRSFAKSRLNGTQDTGPVTQPGDVRDSSDRSPVSTLSHSASTSSMSPAPAPFTRNNDAAKNDTVDWEEKIESFVQPARRVSSEISNKMKEKLANFEDSKSGKEATPVRMIEPDNSFKDKLKAFKTIENSSGEPAAAGALAGNKPMSRRESEPALMMHNNTKPKGMPSYRSTSSSFMNTFQNNKFFQQVTKLLNATTCKNTDIFLAVPVWFACPHSSDSRLWPDLAPTQHDLSISFIHFFPFLHPVHHQIFFLGIKSSHQLA